MKILGTIFSFLLIQAFFGCTESLVNQPVIPPDTGSNKPNYINITDNSIKGEINICCAVFDPISGDCKINGKVNYLHNVLENVSPMLRVKVDLEMDAELCTKLMIPMRNSIYGMSSDTLLIEENGKLLLDKSYQILFRPDLRLCVQYVVYHNEVNILVMNLLQMVD